ncbi:MAG: AEC family transporter, partial [Rhodospirillaceae bacterium]|nr:AEC family transporter [Rhodospirillaceae bacterium]
MSAIAQGLLPVFLLIAIGFAIRRYQWISDSFWAPAEKITYYVFFPALLIASGSRADLGGAQVWPMAFSLFSATFIAAMIALALKPTLD